MLRKLLAWSMLGVVIAATFAVPAAAQQPGATGRPTADAKPIISPEPDESWTRLIYVPYRTLKSVFDNPEANAIVPLREYLRLWEAAGGIKPQPPVAAAVIESTYSAKVEKDLVRIQATLIVQSLKKGWAEAAVRFGEAAVGKMTTDNDRVLLRGLGPGNYALLLPDAGRYKVELELSTRVRTSPDGRSFEFDCPTVGITTLEALIPEPDQTIELQPQPVLLPADADKNQTRIKANLGSTPRIAVRWHPRVSTKPDMELLAGVTNTLHVNVGDGLVRSDARLVYQVFRGEIGQVRIAVPKGDRILDVSAPKGGLRSWKAEAEANRQVIIADLLSNVSKEIAIEVHTERPLPADDFDVIGVGEKDAVFGIHAVGVIRESGVLILTRSGGIETTVNSEKGLVRIDAAEAPEEFRKPDASFYKFYGTAVRLTLESKSIVPQVVVTHRSRFQFAEDELKLNDALHYDITRAGLFEIRLKLPQGLVIDSVDCGVMKAYHVDDATRMLSITLDEKRQGAIDVALAGHVDLSKLTEVVLPLPEPQNVAREEGLVEAFALEGIELVADEAKLGGVRPEPPKEGPVPTNMHPAGTWSYSRRPAVVSLKTVRKPTRLTARIHTTIDAQQESATVTSDVQFLVENAGIDTFRVAVPEAVADKVQIQAITDAAGVGLKQQSRDEKAVDGMVAWSIVLQQKVTGAHVFRLRYDLKPTAAAARDKKLPEATLAISLPQALGLKNADGSERVPLAQVEGEVAVIKDRALSVTTADVPADVEVIDVRELKQPNPNAYLAYRYEKQPIAFKLALVKYGVQEVTETVVSRALHEIVVGTDGNAVYRSRFAIKSSQRQRLALELPLHANPFGVFLDGKPAALEQNPAPAKDKEWTSYFVNVVRSKSSDQPLLLTVQFRWPLNPVPFEAKGGHLTLFFPRVGGAAGTVVQQSRTAIWIPRKYNIVTTPDDFQPESRTLATFFRAPITRGPELNQLDQWIGGNSGAPLDFPTEGRNYIYSRLGPSDSITVTWVNMSVYTFVLSLAVAIIAFLIRKLRLDRLATIVLTVGLVATLYALVDRELVWHIALMARYGLAAAFILWMIEAAQRFTTVVVRPVTPAVVTAPVPPAEAPAESASPPSGDATTGEPQ